MFRFVFGRHEREVHGLGHLAHRPKPLVEADARRVDVEQPCAVRSRVRERVHGRRAARRRTSRHRDAASRRRRGTRARRRARRTSRRGRRGCAGPGPSKPGSSSNSIRASSSRPILIVAIRVFPLEPFPFARAAGRRRRFPGGRFRPARRRCRSPPARRDLAPADFRAKPPSGVWKLRKRARRRGPEAVHDLRRCGDERARREQLLLVVDQNCEPALEDVERIRVLPVEVRARSVARGIGNSDSVMQSCSKSP